MLCGTLPGFRAPGSQAPESVHDPVLLSTAPLSRAKALTRRSPTSGQSPKPLRPAILASRFLVAPPCLSSGGWAAFHRNLFGVLRVPSPSPAFVGASLGTKVRQRTLRLEHRQVPRATAAKAAQSPGCPRPPLRHSSARLRWPREPRSPVSHQAYQKAFESGSCHLPQVQVGDSTL